MNNQQLQHQQLSSALINNLNNPQLSSCIIDSSPHHNSNHHQQQHQMLKANTQIVPESGIGGSGASSSMAIISADFDFLNECANTISLDKKY